MDQRLARRQIEGVDDAQGDAERDNMQRMNPAHQRQQRQHQGLRQGRALSPDGHPMA